MAMAGEYIETTDSLRRRAENAEQTVLALFKVIEQQRAALVVAQEYLSLSLGSPAYDGPDPYPIIAAAIEAR